MSCSFRFPAALLFLFLYSAAAQSGSTSLLSISDGLSASVGSLSNSVSGSSKGVAKVVNLNEGDYRVVEVADAHDATARVRLTLVPTDENRKDEGFYLFVRADQFAHADVRRDGIVSIKPRPYGVAVFDKGLPEPFALVLNDTSSSLIDPTPVSL